MVPRSTSAYFEQTLKAAVKAPSIRDNVSFEASRAFRDPESQDSVIVTLTRPEAFLADRSGELVIYGIHRTTRSAPDRSSWPRRLARRSTSTAFTDYYQGAPKLDQIEIENFGEQRGAWAALMRGDIDAVHEIAPTAIDFVQAEGQTL